jgi:hypothetical protein
MSEQDNPAQPSFESLRLSIPIDISTGFAIDPRDLSIVAPKGNGVYGYQEPERLPFHDAPLQDDIGGVIHFSNKITKPDFEALSRILGIQDAWTVKASKQYGAFIEESENPGEDGFLKQMRIVNYFGLRYLFQAISDKDYRSFPEQPMTIREALWSFMESEKQNWGTQSWKNPKLAGEFGGDGRFASEVLSFGLMVENSYHGVYRIWSRAWLNTK